MFGTPLDLVKAKAPTFYRNDIELMCFDDADVTFNFDECHSLISGLPEVQIVGCSSSFVDMINARHIRITRRPDLSTKLQHFYAIENDFYTKIGACYGLVTKEGGQRIIFCKTRRLAFAVHRAPTRKNRNIFLLHTSDAVDRCGNLEKNSRSTKDNHHH